MPRLLDELAEALHTVRGKPCPRRVVASLELREQFGLPITPTRWQELGRQLSVSLPPLKRHPGRLWSFPDGWRTVCDLALSLAEQRTGGELAADCSAGDWQEAQIFIGVRDCLVEVALVDPEAIVRSARLEADLGLS
jgi:hypothetical protein